MIAIGIVDNQAKLSHIFKSSIDDPLMCDDDDDAMQTVLNNKLNAENKWLNAKIK